MQSPGYATVDDFGNDGDDTIHSPIPRFTGQDTMQINASFPVDGSLPTVVDLVFPEPLQSDVVKALRKVGGNATDGNVLLYMPESFTTNDLLPAYARLNWQDNISNCPLGEGIGV